ncbi:MAG: alanine:cation symporter family protein, partial [Pseudohongiellaceae bacterium]
RAHEPVSEGLVSLLEPFIDTLIICTITGLVILSSGVWTQKFDNDFQITDLVILEGNYIDQNPQDRAVLFDYLVEGNPAAVTVFNGTLSVNTGLAAGNDHTVIHARSVAEDVVFIQAGGLYTGDVEIANGLPADPSISLRGKSLLHSAVLTSMAFTYGFFGQNGQYIVTLALVLFAFSTAIAWSYYGDRAIIFLLGFRWVLPYRMVYCLAFFIAAFTDTTIVWNFAAVAIVLMTLPNLLGIFLLRREMKALAGDYWKDYRKKPE